MSMRGLVPLALRWFRRIFAAKAAIDGGCAIVLPSYSKMFLRWVARAGMSVWMVFQAQRGSTTP